MKTLLKKKPGLAQLISGMFLIMISTFISCNNHDLNGPCNSTLSFCKKEIPQITLGQYLEGMREFNREVASRIEDDYYGIELKEKDKLASRHITFSLSYLKNFINEVEHILAENENRIETYDSIGITWTYAMYSRSDPTYPNLQTLYGVPSVYRNGIAHRIGLIDNGEIIVPLQRIKEIGQYFNSSTHIIGGSDEAAFNHGQLCQPFCPDDN